MTGPAVVQAGRRSRRLAIKLRTGRVIRLQHAKAESAAPTERVYPFA